jgi:hypothetical protein
LSALLNALFVAGTERKLAITLTTASLVLLAEKYVDWVALFVDTMKTLKYLAVVIASSAMELGKLARGRLLNI